MAAWGQQDNSTAGLQKQYNDLSSQLAGGVNGSFDSPAYYALRNQRDQLGARMGQSANTDAASQGTDLAKTRQQILADTEGRGDTVMNDAMTNAALGRLQGVATGEDAPFTQSVQNQMLAKQAGMNASGQASQAESLRMQAAGNGGSIADPSYQAKLRELAANSQASNLSAQGEIGTTAQLQNFGARQTANNSLLSGRMGQLGMANSQYNLGANYLNQTQQNSAHQSGTTTAPMYNFYGQAPSSPYSTPQVSPYPKNPAAAPAAGPTHAGSPVINPAGGVGSQQYGPPSSAMFNPAGGVGAAQYGPPNPYYNFDPNLPVY